MDHSSPMNESSSKTTKAALAKPKSNNADLPLKQKQDVEQEPIHDTSGRSKSEDARENHRAAATATATETATATATETNDNKLEANSDAPKGTRNNKEEQNNIDPECETLLRNTKKQVKQMMEEAVTRKFIHEESGTIMSLCVAIDACLSHGLKRRALGLFKTSSSTALIQKVAKSCPEAAEILQLAGQELDKSNSENNNNSNNNTNFNRFSLNSNKSLPWRQLSTNHANLHRRNLWIKCALIEKKLVPIMDHLANEASKYYEPEALMSNVLCAQILSSLLIGPAALEFSKSKTNDYYQFDEPNAEELLKRHKLTNPIACLCQQQKVSSYVKANNSADFLEQKKNNNIGHKRLSRSATDGSSVLINPLALNKQSNMTPNNSNPLMESQKVYLNDHDVDDDDKESTQKPKTKELLYNKQREQYNISTSSSNFRFTTSHRRRKPLALKTSLKRGTLLTDCHHYDCQEISEHHSTRGYSIVNCSPNNSHMSNSLIQSSSNKKNFNCQCWKDNQKCSMNHGSQFECCQENQNNNNNEWPALWSPRMLHETLHQNSRSCLLYAKNNVLLESQPLNFMPGYLSLHQTTSDLVLKWIPNNMINGGQTSEHRCSSESETFTCDTSTADSHGQRNHIETPINNQQNHLAAKSNPIPVDSSYLDYVVHLPVSRIVLLHCQFVNNQNQQQLSQSMEETLILVEADGVQLAPFKFPKGGLRLFLSCLQSGLRPDKYLEPAIKFEQDNSFDPLAFEGESNESPTIESRKRQALELSGKLEGFLKRLPSLKRNRSNSITGTGSTVMKKGNSDEQTPDTISEDIDSTSSSKQEFKTPDDSHNSTRTNSTQTTPSKERENKYQPTGNYVYRILSHQEPDWPLQTPPHSALSVGSSSSTQSSNKPNNQEASTSKQRFRWSLARLTKLYSTNNNSTGSSSSLNTPVAGPSLLSSQSTGNDFSQDSLLTPNKQPFGPTAPDYDENFKSTLALGNSEDLARIEDKLTELKKSTSSDLLALRTKSLKTLCESMQKQILARAFYGWLAHCRKVKIIRKHLRRLILEVNHDNDDDGFIRGSPLTEKLWSGIIKSKDKDEERTARKVFEIVYFGGIESDRLRRKVWPYLLGHYKFNDTQEERLVKDKLVKEGYESSAKDWLKIERVIKERDSEILAANMAKAKRRLAEETDAVNNDNNNKEEQPPVDSSLANSEEPGEAEVGVNSLEAEEKVDDNDSEKDKVRKKDKDDDSAKSIGLLTNNNKRQLRKQRQRRGQRRHRLESTGSVGSDASITDQFGNNIHRIDKDVQRCDRNFWYFKDTSNLEKLRNIMCSYVWQHLDVGYVQGMCDLAAPLLVIFDDEILTFSCFTQLMKRMVVNFPHGDAMDQHFESLKYLMQILDPKLFQVFQNNGDYTHFYFCYRWLLLDFKRELVYEDVYKVWETIWSARLRYSENFVVFMALAMVRYYRDIIIENNMDFTDTIKFFNEMAEKHQVDHILQLARTTLRELQELIRLNALDKKGDDDQNEDDEDRDADG